MIVTLIKNGENQLLEAENSHKLTYSAVANLIKSTVMLLHFGGKRPLYSADDKGKYRLNIPTDTLPLPDFIMTESKIESYDSGRAVREALQAEKIEPIAIQSTRKIQYPEAISQKSKHMIIVGDETTLRKWSEFLCKESDLQRAENSEFCIIKNGKVFYDSKTNTNFYLQDGVMDTMLLHHIYTTPIEKLEKNLLPYRNQIGEIVPTQFILNKIYAKKDR